MKASNKPIVEYNSKEYEFMNSLSSAILEQSPSRVSKVIKLWLISMFLFIAWASFASIDEITRGDGKAIPYGQNKIIQNLEGGIVESILVQEGEVVKFGQVILKINNAKSTPSLTIGAVMDISSVTNSRDFFSEFILASASLYSCFLCSIC